MRPTEYQKLEDNKAFKRYYLSKTLWWTEYAFVPPALLIFIGLAGVIHMAYNELLWSWRGAPYVLVFALGAIWLKATKRHVQNKILGDKSKYLLCAGRAVFDAEGRYYFIFSKDSKRHNETLMNKLAGTLSQDSFTADQLKEAKKKAIKISVDGDTDAEVYLRGIQVSSVLKANRANITDGITPLIYVSDKGVFVVRNKDLKKFSY